MRKSYFIFLLLSLSLIVFQAACNKDKEATGIDKELFDMSVSTAGFTYYKNTDVLLDKSSGSGHSEPYLKTRFNATAASHLDTNGKVISGTQFSEGSLIVKELYSSSSSIGRYAILYKDSGNEFADANGWVWGYINADGTVAASAEEKGSGCISCHSQNGNIDYSLMNQYFP
ncbi:MAG: cytochrome P460 family protein [Chitinophagales bacterium]|nr:cytochrome P460 family protein [Chitinophagales bacterium]